MNANDQSLSDLQPVILGADIGVYALARAFHRQYGVRSIVICGAVTGPIADSRILETRVIGDSHDEQQLVAALLEVAAELPERRLVLLANSDFLVSVIVHNRAVLEKHYVVPFLSAELLDELSDKARFAELCERTGVGTPRTIVQDFADAGSDDWQPVPVDFDYPLIAKASSSAEYERVEFDGKMKVFEIGSPDELDRLWQSLRDAGFRGRFVVQELIPGDDTQMWSVTAYVDRHGTVTMACSAHVLLEEHTPASLGNPCAMITVRNDEMLDQARRLLDASGYVGFANFDIKVDPRDGSQRFLEVNPRIGRNNNYVLAAGANPAEFLVRDWVLDEEVAPVVAERRVLYTILPKGLLLKYVRDAELRDQVEELYRQRRVVHPLVYRADRSMRRNWYILLAKVNQLRKFRRYYPAPSASGF